MGQIISSAAKPKRCNANQLSQVPTPAAGEYILVSSDNSMNAAGQGNFDCYIIGDGTTAATERPLMSLADDSAVKDGKNAVSSGALYNEANIITDLQTDFIYGFVSSWGGALVATTSVGWGIHVIAADADKDTDVEITFTRRDSQSYAGRTFIVDSLDLLVAGYNASPFIHTFVRNETEIFPYTIPAGKYLCIFGRINTPNASENDSISAKKYESIKGVISALETEVGTLEAEVEIGLSDDTSIHGMPEDEAQFSYNASTYSQYKGMAMYTRRENADYRFNELILRGVQLLADAVYYIYLYNGTLRDDKKYVPPQVVPNADTSFTLLQSGTLSATNEVTDISIKTDILVCPANTTIIVYMWSASGVRLIGRGQTIPDGEDFNVIYFNTKSTEEEAFASVWYNGQLDYSCFSLEAAAFPKFITRNEADDFVKKDELAEEVADAMAEENAIEINLPDKLYAVVGDTLQIFYRGIIKAVEPYRYNILVACAKGKQMPRYFQYTPTSSDVGTTTFTITIKDDNRNVLSTKTCQLITKASPSSPSSNINVAIFGDSLTSGGTWCHEMERRLKGTGGTPNGNGLSRITFIGAMDNNGTKYFGKGGWRWSSYTTAGQTAYRFFVQGVTSVEVGAVYTNNGNAFTIVEVNITNGSGSILGSVTTSQPLPNTSAPLVKTSGNGDASITFTSYELDSTNPLWDAINNKMSFVPYANLYGGGVIDVVYTLLTWNGITAGQTDFSSMLSDIRTFADTLHTEFPNAKLKIMGVQIPSVHGGMGANYGATGSSYADQYGMVATILNMNKMYQDFANDANYSSFVEFVNISSQFDTEFNMQHTMKDVNTRNSANTEMIDTNGVHPATTGYMQIADAAYRNFVANFC